MDKPRSFKVQTANLPGGIGYTVVITAAKFSDKLDRFYETFVFLVGYGKGLLHYQAFRTGYESIPPEILSNEDVMKHAEGFASAPVTAYLFKHRDELGLSPMTGYHFELEDGNVHDILRLYLTKGVRDRVLEMRHVTLCKELEDLLKGFPSFREGYIDQEDITR